MKPSAAGARGKKTAPPASSSAVAQPTAIDGVRPERIEVHVDELRALSADASEPVCDEAARLLQALTVAMLSQRRAERWGQEVQRACQDGFSGGSVAPVSAPFIEQARADLARMTGILEAIDLKAVCAHAQGGLLAGLAKSVNRKIDTPAKLAGALDELRSLLQRMHAGVGRLLALQDGLRQRAGAFERRQVEVEAAALAALFLSNRLAGSSPTLAQRFAERHMSLGATLAQTRQGDGAYRTHVAQPLQLIGAIQGVALVKVQGLVTEMASLQALAKAGRAFPAEALNMSYRLRDILQQLKN
ncbi:hypothetical protein [Ideonella sp.]|uniref:hypothetical protein n=1 Tax=Ideonella sp. TaxID=1929293 RepID=UPI0035B3C709